MRASRFIALLSAAAVGGCGGATAGSGALTVADPPAASELQLFHSPPMLAIGEEVQTIAADVICVGAETCDAEVTLWARRSSQDEFTPEPMTPRSGGEGVWEAPSPRPSVGGVLEYYITAELPGPNPMSATVPAGGDASPYELWPVSEQSVVEVSLDGVDLGALDSGSVAAAGGWGDGPGQFAFEGGGESDRIGPSSFAVGRDGEVVVLDQFNQRLQRFGDAGRWVEAPVAVGLRGGTPDVALAEDGSAAVLDWGTASDPRPHLRLVGRDGRELGKATVAAQFVDGLSIDDRGQVEVHGYPGDVWIPAAQLGQAPDGSTRMTARTASQQRRDANAARSAQDGRRVLLRAYEEEVRVALLSGRRVLRAWRLLESTPDYHVGEIHVAEVRGDKLWLAARLWSDRHAVYRLVTIDRAGNSTETTTPVDEWADAAPVSRVRLSPAGDWYRLSTRPDGLEIRRYDRQR